VCAILDVGSRRVLGWAIGDHMRVELVCDALRMAVLAGRPLPGLVFHSGCGAQGEDLARSPCLRFCRTNVCPTAPRGRRTCYGPDAGVPTIRPSPPDPNSRSEHRVAPPLGGGSGRAEEIGVSRTGNTDRRADRRAPRPPPGIQPTIGSQHHPVASHSQEVFELTVVADARGRGHARTVGSTHRG
jgi:hypothetical protein